MIKYIQKVIFNITPNKKPCEELLSVCKEKILEVDETIEHLNMQYGNQNHNNQVHINDNNGIVFVQKYSKVDLKLCKAISKLTKKRKEYYYHLIKADLLNSKDY